MWSWIGANSRGNITTGIGFRMGGGGGGPQSGCLAEALGCAGIIVALAIILVVLRLLIIFLEGMGVLDAL